MSSFKSNENIHKKEDGSYYAAPANKAPPATPQWPGNESQRKHTIEVYLFDELGEKMSFFYISTFLFL